MPDILVRPPLLTFTNEGPAVPEPDIPPPIKEQRLASPCPSNSRLEL